ncbi:MAG: beta-ketoacyl synthase N-terminal-like domain-containing protein [Planctomycetota bacterium]
MRRRVVITGAGPVSSLGLGPAETWDALYAGRIGPGVPEGIDLSGYPCGLAGEVAGLDVRQFVPKHYRKATKVMARDTQLAVAAAQIAACDARLKTRGSAESPQWAAGGDAFEIAGDRLGCQIGAGLIAAETSELSRALATAADEGEPDSFSTTRWGDAESGGEAMNNLQPLWMLKYLPNMLACHVTITHGATGPSNTITCAEASGLLSVGEAARVIERGAVDACLAGGIESKLNPMSMARLTVAKRLAPTDGSTDAAEFARPYDAASPGQLPGEGGAIFVVEGADHAAARGLDASDVYAEIAGFGAGHNTRHAFAGLFDADPGDSIIDVGLRRAVSAALRDAGIGPDEIDAIAPGATGVGPSDRAELNALAEVFGDRLAQIPMLTTTPASGGLNAGQSAFQIAAAALAIKNRSLPTRVHSGTPDRRADCGAAGAADADLRAVLVCCPSLGGQAAAMVQTRADLTKAGG